MVKSFKVNTHLDCKNGTFLIFPQRQTCIFLSLITKLLIDYLQFLKQLFEFANL
jgi:hypothetical protein